MIESERLMFREWKVGDEKILVESLNDFDIAKNLTVPHPYTETDANEYIKKHGQNKENDFHFAIVLKETEEVIGGTNVSIKEGKCGGGIWLVKNFQGKGYGTEAYRLRAKFAFETLEAQKLSNGFFDFNKKSQHMHEKVGYKIVGEQQKFCPALNKNCREFQAELTKEEFYKNN